MHTAESSKRNHSGLRAPRRVCLATQRVCRSRRNCLNSVSLPRFKGSIEREKPGDESYNQYDQDDAAHEQSERVHGSLDAARALSRQAVGRVDGWAQFVSSASLLLSLSPLQLRSLSFPFLSVLLLCAACPDSSQPTVRPPNELSPPATRSSVNPLPKLVCRSDSSCC